MNFSGLKKDIEAYLQDKKWYWFLPVWLIGAYVFVQLLSFDVSKQLPFVIAVPQSFDFLLHETAHILTAFLPPLVTASSGSLSEILLGVLLIYIAFKTRGYFSVLICSLWFMLACQSAGSYMADARVQRYDLVSLGGVLSGSETTIHDWHYVFGRLHLLRFDWLIGGSVRLLGVLVGLAGLLFTGWLLYRMAVRD